MNGEGHNSVHTVHVHAHFCANEERGQQRKRKEKCEPKQDVTQRPIRKA